MLASTLLLVAIGAGILLLLLLYAVRIYNAGGRPHWGSMLDALPSWARTVVRIAVPIALAVLLIVFLLAGGVARVV